MNFGFTKLKHTKKMQAVHANSSELKRKVDELVAVFIIRVERSVSSGRNLFVVCFRFKKFD